MSWGARMLTKRSSRCAEVLPAISKSTLGEIQRTVFQLDWRLGLIVDLQLASQTPLIEP